MEPSETEANEILTSPDAGSEQSQVDQVIDGLNNLSGSICAKKYTANLFFAMLGLVFRFDLSNCPPPFGAGS